MKKKTLFYTILIYLLNGCIGTDEVTIEEQELDHLVTIEPLSSALTVGDTLRYKASYFDLGKEKAVTILWSSSNPEIASVDDEGLVSAKAEGSTFITANYNQYKSKKAVLNVTNDTTKLAYIKLSSLDQIVSIGDSTQLTIQSFNVKNKELFNKIYKISITPSGLATINESLYLKSKNSGTYKVIASSEGINSNEISVLFSNNVKKGTFTSKNYDVRGQVSIMYEDNKYKLIFEDNFYAQNGPGLVIYVSNSNTNVVSEGKRIDVLPKNAGSFMIDISDKISSLEQFKYVVIHCEPFNVPFGYAELN